MKEDVSSKPLLDQRSGEKRVEDPADELKEMAEVRAKTWQAESTAAEVRMADLKEFEESRTSSFGTEGLQMVYGEIEALTEERSHAGNVFPEVLKTEHWLSVTRDKRVTVKGLRQWQKA